MKRLSLLTLTVLLSMSLVFSGCGKQEAAQSSASSAASAASAASTGTSGSGTSAASSDSAAEADEGPVYTANIGTALIGDAAAPLAVYNELLYDYGHAFSGASVASAITVAEIDNNIVYADTEGNDSGAHSLAFVFDDASAISTLQVGDNVVIVGTVNEPALAGDMITLTGCTLYLTGEDVEPMSAIYQDCCDSQIQYAESVISTAESAVIADADQASYISGCSPVDYAGLSDGSVETDASVAVTAVIQQITDGWQDVVVIRAADPSDTDTVWYITCHAPAQTLNAGETMTFYGKYRGCESFSDCEGIIDEVYLLQADVLSSDAVSSADSTAAEAATEITEFSDVDASSPYYDAITWALRSGIVSGSGDAMFSPDETCTREQMAAFLWRLVGKPEVLNTESPFSDVTDPSSPFYYAILWNYENGITSGSSDGIFSGEDIITRAQAIVMLWNMAEKPAPESETSVFADVDPSAYYYKAVQWAYEYGICSADDGSFQPDAPCTRAEVIQYIYLFANAV